MREKICFYRYDSDTHGNIFNYIHLNCLHVFYTSWTVLQCSHKGFHSQTRKKCEKRKKTMDVWEINALDTLRIECLCHVWHTLLRLIPPAAKATGASARQPLVGTTSTGTASERSAVTHHPCWWSNHPARCVVAAGRNDTVKPWPLCHNRIGCVAGPGRHRHLRLRIALLWQMDQIGPQVDVYSSPNR